MKNGWLDEENRAYIIYTVENIMEDLGCSRGTCAKVMKELARTPASHAGNSGSTPGRTTKLNIHN